MQVWGFGRQPGFANVAKEVRKLSTSVLSHNLYAVGRWGRWGTDSKLQHSYARLKSLCPK